MKPLLDRIKDRCRIDEDGCWVWTQGVSSEGYPLMAVAGLTPKKSPLYVRRLVYVVACGGLIAKRRVASTCENRLCCNPAHLFAACESELARLEARKLRVARGRQKSLAIKRGKKPRKVGYDKADEIRRLRAAGVKRTEVARQFGVHPSLVSQITSGRAWVRGPWAI